jgi:DNA-binding LacI/PurR family transcriptional regulator
VTLHDLARELGVSASTVSRALADSPAISEAVRLTVKRLAAERGYVIAARKRRAPAREPQLTVVMPPYRAQHVARVTEPFVLNLLGGITGAMRERGLSFQVSHRVASDDRSLRELMEASPHDAFIFLGQSQFHSGLNEQARLGRAFVVWGAERPDQLYASVGSDNLRAGYRVTAHLLRLGRRKIAFFGNPEYLEIADRLEGYRAALRDHGISASDDLILPTELAIEDGLYAAQELLGREVSFDAVFAATDMLAFGVIRGLARHGLHVPRDVSVVGFDDVDSAQHSNPRLTTVRQDPLHAGRLLTLKLIRRMGGQRVESERIETELIVRDSCGA